MKHKFRWTAMIVSGVLALSLLAGCGDSPANDGTPATVPEGPQGEVENEIPDGALVIAEQGMFSSGGTVTEPVAGDYDATTNWLDAARPGNTAHVGHANVLYQIPAESTGLPMVFLHGYGQSRMGWMTTPDGREGWDTMFLRRGHSVFLVDQPGRGEAGAATEMTMDGMLDTWAEDSKEYKPGDQAWYTHFRIGRVAPERYEGSQFPEGDEAQNQFFRQMTPNTTSFDQAASAAALGEVMADVKAMTGQVHLCHPLSGRRRGLGCAGGEHRRDCRHRTRRNAPARLRAVPAPAGSQYSHRGLLWRLYRQRPRGYSVHWFLEDGAGRRAGLCGAV